MSFVKDWVFMNWNIRKSDRKNVISAADEELFQRHRSNFTSMEKSLGKLQDNCKKYNKQLQALKSNEVEIYSELYKYADESVKAKFLAGTAQSNLDEVLTREVNEHSNVVDESMVMPLKKFAKLVPNEVKDAIKRRETAADKYASAQRNFDEMERNRDKIMQYKLERAAKEVETYRRDFETCNSNCSKDLKFLYEVRSDYIAPSFETFVHSQKAVFDSMGGCYDEILQSVDPLCTENSIANRLDATFRDITSLSIVSAEKS